METAERSSSVVDRSTVPGTCDGPTDLQREIIRFSRSLYEKHRQVPTIAQITSAFKITRTEFYRLFTGLVELCRLAGIPIPEARINKTQAASIIRSGQNISQAAARPRVSIELNDEQTRRVLAISHIEGGIDPSLVVDRLLDTDSVMRHRHELNFDNVKLVATIAAKARKLGYSTSRLLSLTFAADRVGLTLLNEDTASYLISILRELHTLGFSIGQVAEALSTLRKLGFFQLNEGENTQLIEWFKWAEQRLGNVALLPEYMTSASWILGPFFEYMKGRITLEAFLEQVNAE